MGVSVFLCDGPATCPTVTAKSKDLRPGKEQTGKDDGWIDVNVD